MDDFLKGCLIGLLVRVLIKAFPYLLVIALVIWLARTVVPSLKNVLGGIELPAIPKVSGPVTEPQVGQTTGGAPGTYTVQEGDMLSKIAKKFDTSVEVLVELNKDRYPSLETNPGLIQPGWELTVRSTSVSGSIPTPIPIPGATPQVVVTATEHILGLKFYEIAPNAKVITFKGNLSSGADMWAKKFWPYVIVNGMEVEEAARQAAKDAGIEVEVYGNQDFKLNPRKEGIVDVYGFTRCKRPRSGKTPTPDVCSKFEPVNTSYVAQGFAYELQEAGYTSRLYLDVLSPEDAIDRLPEDEIFFFYGHGLHDRILFYDNKCNCFELLPSHLSAKYEKGELTNLRLVVLLACGD